MTLPLRRPLGLVTAILALTWSYGAQDGTTQMQERTASGKSGADVVQIGRTEIFLGNDPGDTGRLESHTRTLSSDDPDWNKARVFSVRFTDPYARREGQARGYMVVTHPRGDQTFLAYELKWSTGGVESDFTLSGHFVRGTGKFTGIRGTWRERGRLTMTTVTSEWTVDYEVR